MPVHKIIFLQYEDDAAAFGETTWCEDRINDTDLVYHLVSEPLQMVIRCEACGMFGTPVQDAICGNCGSSQTDVFIRIPSGLTCVRSDGCAGTSVDAGSIAGAAAAQL